MRSGLRHGHCQHEGQGCNRRQGQERDIIPSELDDHPGQPRTEGGAQPECGGHRAQRDIDATGSLGEVTDDDREQGAEDAGTNTIEQLYAEQPGRRVG